jgi:hypothetical protein
MTSQEPELEEARRQVLQRMQEPQSRQALSQLRQELRAIDVELDNVKRIAAILAVAPQQTSRLNRGVRNANAYHAGIAGLTMKR